MQITGHRDVHNELPQGLWALGQRRGTFEAFRYDASGKRIRRSLATSSEQEADALLKKLNDEHVAGGVLNVEGCFALYKLHKQQKGKWNQSMERARKIIVDQIGQTLPSDISVQLCETMIENRQKLGLAPDTIRIEMAYFRAAIYYAAQTKKWKEKPFVKVPEGGEARERWLTQDEVRRLISGAVELHVKLFIILSVTTAARPSHILQLLWDAIDFDHRIVNFRHQVEVNGKKMRPRVPVNDTLLEHLNIAKELRRTEHVIEFRGRSGFKRIYKGVTEAARRAGIQGMSPYVLRHTAGVWMAKAGVPMEKIAAFMGHKDIKTTTKHYAHFHPSFMQDAASALEIGPEDGPELHLVHDGPEGRTSVEPMVQSGGTV